MRYSAVGAFFPPVFHAATFLFSVSYKWTLLIRKWFLGDVYTLRVKEREKPQACKIDIALLKF